MRCGRSAISHWAVVVLGVSGRGAVGLVLQFVMANFWYGGWNFGVGLAWSLIFFCLGHLKLGGGQGIGILGGAVLVVAYQAAEILVKLRKSRFFCLEKKISFGVPTDRQR